jgi:hypothetical protein
MIADAEARKPEGERKGKKKPPRSRWDPDDTRGWRCRRTRLGSTRRREGRWRRRIGQRAQDVVGNGNGNAVVVVGGGTVCYISPSRSSNFTGRMFGGGENGDGTRSRVDQASERTDETDRPKRPRRDKLGTGRDGTREGENARATKTIRVSLVSFLLRFIFLLFSFSLTMTDTQ